MFVLAGPARALCPSKGSVVSGDELFGQVCSPWERHAAALLSVFLVPLGGEGSGPPSCQGSLQLPDFVGLYKVKDGICPNRESAYDGNIIGSSHPLPQRYVLPFWSPNSHDHPRPQSARKGRRNLISTNYGRHAMPKYCQISN